MRFALFLALGLLVLPGCDQALDTHQALDTDQAGAAMAKPEAPSPTQSQTFALGSDTHYDLQFIFNAPPDDALTVQTLDHNMNVLAEFQESRASQAKFAEAPYEISVSGPVTQDWDMIVCPVDSIDETPHSSDPRCDVMARTDSTQHQMMGAAAANVTSVHHKPGHTYYDYTDTVGSGVQFFVPSVLPAPGEPLPPPTSKGYKSIPEVEYVMMSPVDALGDYGVKYIRLIWPSTSSLNVTCVQGHLGGNTTCGGGENGGGGGTSEGDGDIDP